MSINRRSFIGIALTTTVMVGLGADAAQTKSDSKPSHWATSIVRNGYIGRVRRVTTCVPGTDIPCPPQVEMPVPKGLDYERWQGPAPRAPYTEKRVHAPESYARPGWMRHLYYCDGLITNWGIAGRLARSLHVFWGMLSARLVCWDYSV